MITREDGEKIITAVVNAVIPAVLRKVDERVATRPVLLSEEDKRRLVGEVAERLEAIVLPGFARQDELVEVRRLMENLGRELAELRKQVNGGIVVELPVGGERVAAKVRELYPDLTDNEAIIAKAREAFKAIGRDDPEAAIQYLEEIAAEGKEESEATAEPLPKDVATTCELIAAGLGYQSLATAKSQATAIKKLASVFVRRADGRRTSDQLNEAVANAVSAGKLRLKK